jgi:hypothetical protein
VPHMEQELLIPGFNGICVARSVILCVVFSKWCYVLFLLTIALSILLRFTAFHNPFCMFKLFLKRLFLINSCKSDLIRYFCPLLWVITGYHIRVTWRVSLMEQELISFRSTWFLPDFKWCSCCSMVSVLCSVQSTISFFWQICLFVFKK